MPNQFVLNTLERLRAQLELAQEELSNTNVNDDNRRQLYRIFLAVVPNQYGPIEFHDDRWLKFLQKALAKALSNFEKLLVESTVMNKPLSLEHRYFCLLYTSPSPRDGLLSRMPSSA